jgi:hypothetical protein
VKAFTHYVWIRLPDGHEQVAGRAHSEEQAQYIRAQLVACAERAGWRYVYDVRPAPPEEQVPA